LNGSTFYNFEKPLLTGEVFPENGLSGLLQEELIFFGQPKENPEYF
jgi:hypothetical protein